MQSLMLDSISHSTMNAVSTSTPDFIQDNAGDSDSDTNSEEFPEYYEPISTEADEEFSEQNSNSDESNFHRLPNGYATHCLENGVTSIDLRDVEENGENSDKEGGEEEAEEARMREVMRAFREDEQRRNAPLPAENSVRVMEAMRGISFGGTAPNWANSVPEDQWIHQLRGLRRSSPPSATSTAVQD